MPGRRPAAARGASSLAVPPGGAAEALSETPDAPCEEVDRTEFVLGACRIAGPGLDAG